jgi:hypothetical protein
MDVSFYVGAVRQTPVRVNGVPDFPEVGGPSGSPHQAPVGQPGNAGTLLALTPSESAHVDI